MFNTSLATLHSLTCHANLIYVIRCNVCTGHYCCQRDYSSQFLLAYLPLRSGHYLTACANIHPAQGMFDEVICKTNVQNMILQASKVCKKKRNFKIQRSLMIFLFLMRNERRRKKNNDALKVEV